MEKTKETQHRRIQQYFKPYIKDILENIDHIYQDWDKKGINRLKHEELRKIYHSSLPFEKSWLKLEYPRVKKWQIKWFPRPWMEDEECYPKMAQAIERCPAFYPIVNYLFDYNRYWHGKYYQERKKMEKEADKITRGKRYKTAKGDRIYSTFLTGEAFYRGICKATDCSKNLIQRYLRALVKVGCLHELSTGKGGKGVLYADGYYLPWRDIMRKISFLKNSTQIRAGLIKLPQWIKEYQKRTIETVETVKTIKRAKRCV